MIYNMTHGNGTKYINNFISIYGFTRCLRNTIIVLKSLEKFQIILLLYVDELLNVGGNIIETKKMKKQLFKGFATKNLATIKKFEVVTNI